VLKVIWLVRGQCVSGYPERGEPCLRGVTGCEEVCLVIPERRAVGDREVRRAVWF
jgi:hypothetical protein